MGKLAQSLLHSCRILLSVVVLTCLTGCGGGGGTPPPPPPAVQNPAPTVTSVSPSSAIVGGQGFTLSVKRQQLYQQLGRAIQRHCADNNVCFFQPTPDFID